MRDHGLFTEMEIEIRNPRDQIVSKKTEKCHSFTNQWIQFIKSLLTQEQRQIKDESGSLRTAFLTPVSPYTAIMKANFGAGVAEGVILGALDTAFDHTDYCLAQKIAEGAGAGQLNYGNQTHETEVLDIEGILSCRIIRTYTNNSGDDVVIKEAGVTVENKSTTSYYFLILREILSSPVTLPNSYTLTVRIKFKTLY
jgi:hypothetical protein